MAEKNIEVVLNKFLPFWEHLSSNQKTLLAAQASYIHYPQGTGVHNGEQECLGLLLVQKGVLRVYLLSDEGKEVTLYRLGPGEICVLSASCVLEAITFDVHIDAALDCDALQISAAAVRKVMKENIQVECFLYKLAAESFSDVMWTMQQILFMSFDRRLAIFLLDESAASDSDTIKMTHEQIAKYVGSAREVVGRMLKYFSSEGLVEISRGGIKLLDKKKMQKLT